MIQSFLQKVAIFVVVCAFAKAYSQEIPTQLLSKNDAVAMMLENNFGIKLANNNVTVA